MNAWLGPRFADEGKALGMNYRLNSEIDIEFGPIKVVRGRQRDVEQLANWRFSEPGEVSKRNEILTVRKQ